jgi:hypothetical protein
MTWMRRLGALALVLFLLGLLAPGLVEAQKGKGATEDEMDDSVYVTDLGSAFQLIEYGRAAKAPEALIMAAGLLQRGSKATLKPLEAKLEVVGEDGKVKSTKAKSAAEPDLALRAGGVIAGARKLAKEQKMDISTLLRTVNKRSPKKGGVIYWYGRTVEPGETHLIRLNIDNERTDVALEASDLVRISVLKDDKTRDVLAATLTGGGSIQFKPDIGTRCVKLKHHDKGKHKGEHKHKHRHKHHGKGTKKRAVSVGGKGDAVIIRIQNPTEDPVTYTLYLN